jgi:NAD+ synthase (glutamine-hydrolysing)
MYLAEHTREGWSKDYTRADLKQWLQVFINRFFSQQFKRSCLPDGPKIGSISLSPRGDWRMPSDANQYEWFKQLKEYGD